MARYRKGADRSSPAAHTSGSARCVLLRSSRLTCTPLATPTTPVTQVMAPKIRLSEESVQRTATAAWPARHAQPVPVRGGAVPRHARRPLPGEHGRSEQEGRRPERQGAGDECHRREAEGGQEEAVAETNESVSSWREEPHRLRPPSAQQTLVSEEELVSGDERKDF